MSPISSKNTVPPSASSNFPGLVVVAPVKAPFTCPKSSLSKRFSGMAPQLIDMNGFARRRDFLWIARATRPLPVPVSPLMRMVLSQSATFSISSNISSMRELRPIISSNRATVEEFSASTAGAEDRSICSEPDLRAAAFCTAISFRLQPRAKPIAREDCGHAQSASAQEQQRNGS